MVCRKRWRVVQNLADQFWSRWRKEYLGTLQSRQKWAKENKNSNIGDIVLIKDSDLFGARNNWPLARIGVVYPDDNGLVKSVELHVSTRPKWDDDSTEKTNNQAGIFRRSRFNELI